MSREKLSEIELYVDIESLVKDYFNISHIGMQNIVNLAECIFVIFKKNPKIADLSERQKANITVISKYHALLQPVLPKRFCGCFVDYPKVRKYCAALVKMIDLQDRDDIFRQICLEEANIIYLLRQFSKLVESNLVGPDMDFVTLCKIDKSGYFQYKYLKLQFELTGIDNIREHKINAVKSEFSALVSFLAMDSTEQPSNRMKYAGLEALLFFPKIGLSKEALCRKLLMLITILPQSRKFICEYIKSHQEYCRSYREVTKEEVNSLVNLSFSARYGCRDYEELLAEGMICLKSSSSVDCRKGNFPINTKRDFLPFVKDEFGVNERKGPNKRELILSNDPLKRGKRNLSEFTFYLRSLRGVEIFFVMPNRLEKVPEFTEKQIIVVHEARIVINSNFIGTEIVVIYDPIIDNYRFMSSFDLDKLKALQKTFAEAVKEVGEEEEKESGVNPLAMRLRSSGEEVFLPDGEKVSTRESYQSLRGGQTAKPVRSLRRYQRAKSVNTGGNKDWTSIKVVKKYKLPKGMQKGYQAEYVVSPVSVIVSAKENRQNLQRSEIAEVVFGETGKVNQLLEENVIFPQGDVGEFSSNVSNMHVSKVSGFDQQVENYLSSRRNGGLIYDKFPVLLEKKLNNVLSHCPEAMIFIKGGCVYSRFPNDIDFEIIMDLGLHNSDEDIIDKVSQLLSLEKDNIAGVYRREDSFNVTIKIGQVDITIYDRSFQESLMAKESPKLLEDWVSNLDAQRVRYRLDKVEERTFSIGYFDIHKAKGLSFVVSEFQNIKIGKRVRNPHAKKGFFRICYYIATVDEMVLEKGDLSCMISKENKVPCNFINELEKFMKNHPMDDEQKERFFGNVINLVGDSSLEQAVIKRGCIKKNPLVMNATGGTGATNNWATYVDSSSGKAGGCGAAEAAGACL